MEASQPCRRFPLVLEPTFRALWANSDTDPDPIMICLGCSQALDAAASVIVGEDFTAFEGLVPQTIDSVRIDAETAQIQIVIGGIGPPWPPLEDFIIRFTATHSLIVAVGSGDVLPDFPGGIVASIQTV